MTFAPSKRIPHSVKLTWFDGGLLPPMDAIPGLAAFAAENGKRIESQKAEKAKNEGKAYTAPETIAPVVPDNGLIIVGSKATTIGESHARRPNRLAGDAQKFDAALKEGDKHSGYNHYREFVEAVQAKAPVRCGSRLAYAAPLTEALLIGCIALRYPGEELRFDPKTMQFTNKPEANAFLKAPKRGDWDFAKLMGK